MPNTCRRWKSRQIWGAYEVPEWKRIAQICVAIVYTVLAGGIVFGYAALKPLLIKEGIYRERCTQDELDNGVGVCYGQEIQLNFMFTVAAAAVSIIALPVGAILDACGPKITGIIGSVIIALGALLFSNPAHLRYDGHLLGFLLLAIGGTFIFIPSFQLSNTFPKHSGLILCLLACAFDCSSILFSLFRLLHGSANGFFTIRSLFLLYLAVPGFILLSQVFLMPSRSYSTIRELLQHAEEMLVDESMSGARDHPPRYQRLISKINTLRGFQITDMNSLDSSRMNLTNDPTWGMLHTSSASQQIRSPWFTLIATFTVLQMLRINFFIATIRSQYEYLLSSLPEAKRLNHFFDFGLPMGGIVAIPLIGIILDQTSLPCILTTLAIGATLTGILGCIPHDLSAAYANIVLFVIYRPYFYTVISDYAAKVFGFQTFGKVYGLIICLGGLGNLLQIPLNILVIKHLGGNPIPVNIGLTAVGALVGGALALFVWWKMRRLIGVSIGVGHCDAAETERLLPGNANDI